MANKYCTKCGAEIPEGAAFCSKCGHPVGQEPLPYNDDNEQRVNRKSLYALAAVLGLLLLIIVGTMYYFSYQEEKEAQRAKETLAKDSLEMAQKANSEQEQQEDDVIETQGGGVIQLVRSSYEEVLDQYIANDESDSYWGEYYFLYDIDGNGIPELWVQVKDDDMFYLDVYTVRAGACNRIFRGNAGHPYHHSFHRGSNYVLMAFAHMGGQSWTKYYMRNDGIEEEYIDLSDDSMPDTTSYLDVEYKEVSEPEITTYDITDKTPIFNIE